MSADADGHVVAVALSAGIVNCSVATVLTGCIGKARVFLCSRGKPHSSSLVSVHTGLNLSVLIFAPSQSLGSSVPVGGGRVFMRINNCQE